MTFGELIKVMNSTKAPDGTKFFRMNRDKIAVGLLKAAGISTEKNADEMYVNKWIDRKVPDNIVSYFPEGKVNEYGIICWLKGWLKDRWKTFQVKFELNNLQAVFKEAGFDKLKAMKSSCIVDCSTDDREVFILSLCKQFSMSLGLPFSEESDDNSSSDNESPISSSNDRKTKDLFKTEATSLNNSETATVSQNKTPYKDEPYAKTDPTRLPEIFSVPYKRNKHFTGRSDYLTQINDGFAVTLANEPIYQTIWGLDGFGKTQLVLKYAFKNKWRYRAVCWIECFSEETIEMSCKSFLVSAKEMVDTDIVSTCTQWFHNNSGWLLILDNANDFKLVEKLLPKVGNGHILLTTQQHIDSAIELRCMSKDEAVDFFIKRTSIDDAVNAERIVARLSCLPLALEQAAAFICETKYDFTKYLKLLHEHGLNLLDSDDCVDNYGRNIHTIWNITLEKISENSKMLINCFAYMSADSIEVGWLTEYASSLKNIHEEPAYLLSPIKKNGTLTGTQIDISGKFVDYIEDSKMPSKLITVLTDEIALIKTLMELQRFSLVSQKVDNSYVMHTLLHEVIRIRIKDLSFLFSIFEMLRARCNGTDLLYDDYRIALSLPQAKPLLRNIYAFFGYFKKLIKRLSKDESYKTSIDIEILEFQLNSFIAQYLTLCGNDSGDSCVYEEADNYYSKACELALLLFGGGENDTISSTRSFTLIQEKHRRMRVNLLLGHNGVAERLYEEVKQVLKNSAYCNAGMVEQAFTNFAELWNEFGFLDVAMEARKLATKRLVKNTTSSSLGEQL